MTNKYAEGLPRKRYYGGCEFVDIAEEQAIARVKLLFGAEHANVQPHSGASANLGAYFAVSKPGDVLLGMSLAHGGHLTHGHPVSLTGQIWRSVQYGVRAEDGRVDYDQVEKLAKEHRPRILVAGASAYPRIFDFERFAAIAREVGATLVVDMAHIAGLVAAGLHPSPVPHAELVTSTTHKTLRGPRGGFVLSTQALAEKLDKSVFPGMQGGPLMHVIAAKAVCFGEALTEEFRGYQRRIVENARTLAESLVGHGFDLVTGGTDNHLMLVDLRPRGLTGVEAQTALDHAAITVNKNAIPFDTEAITKTGGIRIGTPAMTTRGMKEEEMMEIADLIHATLEGRADPAKVASIREEVLRFTSRFPLP
jgi:glycine hydroxymethyltransferase